MYLCLWFCAVSILILLLFLDKYLFISRALDFYIFFACGKKNKIKVTHLQIMYQKFAWSCSHPIYFTGLKQCFNAPYVISALTHSADCLSSQRLLIFNALCYALSVLLSSGKRYWTCIILQYMIWYIYVYHHISEISFYIRFYKLQLSVLTPSCNVECIPFSYSVLYF